MFRKTDTQGYTVPLLTIQKLKLKCKPRNTAHFGIKKYKDTYIEIDGYKRHPSCRAGLSTMEDIHFPDKADSRQPMWILFGSVLTGKEHQASWSASWLTNYAPSTLEMLRHLGQPCVNGA